MIAETTHRQCLAGYDEAVLKAFVDGELPAGWAETLRMHMQGCRACTERIGRLRLDGALAHGRLALLEDDVRHIQPAADRPTVAALLAQARREARPIGHASGWRVAAGRTLASVWRPAPRLAAAAAGVVLVGGLALTQPAVQALAQNVLQQFRVQQVRPVRLDAAILANVDVGRYVETLYRAGTYDGPTEPRVRPATAAEAAGATGLALRGPSRLPAAVKPAPSIWVTEPISFTYTYDGQKLTQLAQEMGFGDPALLAQLRALHGTTARGSIPAAAIVVYGDVAAPTMEQARATATAGARGGPPVMASGSPAIALIQLKSPSLDIASNVDLDRLRQQVLRSGALPPEVANQLLAITDWKSTLPLPISRGQAAEVQVDGTTGTLVTGEFKVPALIWQKDGVLYVMAGSVSPTELLDAARSLVPLR